MSFRGETGAQSSIMPTLVAFMKIKHCQTHRPSRRHATVHAPRPPALIADVEAMPCMRDLADPLAYNDVLEAMATFREVHYGWLRSTSTDVSRTRVERAAHRI
jgi:indoleamine 2,3-dioxygenase